MGSHRPDDLTGRPRMVLDTGWLLIVRNDRPELAAWLEARYPCAAVIVDRRIGERRQRTDPIPIERREGERREPLAPAARAMWDWHGYRLVYSRALRVGDAGRGPTEGALGGAA